MKVDLRDRDALYAVRPSDVAAYLRSRGWQEQEHPGGALTWAEFTLHDFEIALPLSSDLRDFPLRIAEALQTLELAENRDQLQILADLSTTAADVVRVQVLGQEAVDGTLPLDRALEVVTSTHDMMLAAACAAVDPKLFYASRKPTRATEYMRQVRMGQTERGSFVVTVLSRLPPEIPADQAQLLGIEEPFQRRVTDKLSEAMTAATNAAAHAIATGNLNDFEAAVPRGVSANLCDALSGLGTFEGTARNVAVNVSWAKARPTPPNRQDRFVMTPDVGPVFHEAAVLLKTKAPREEFEVRGQVFRLMRDPPNATEGEITVAGSIDGVPRNIWIVLTGADYGLAIQAHDHRSFLSAVGNLKKDGRSYRLHNARDVRIVDEGD